MKEDGRGRREERGGWRKDGGGWMRVDEGGKRDRMKDDGGWRREEDPLMIRSEKSYTAEKI